MKNFSFLILDVKQIKKAPYGFRTWNIQNVALFRNWFVCMYRIVCYILNVLSKKKMAREEDIALAEIVRKYPAVYDKAVPEYHRKDVQKNCWNVIATELGLESD